MPSSDSPFSDHGNRERSPDVEDSVDDEEREAIRAEGFDPDESAVRASLELVRWELELLGRDDL
ncbi:hypothetical protein [Mycobacterium paraterrae]|uniref:Uncharacterized protein n=1 Tax=Mycobacterium paraterrae TaxID=577492 RepID=A0ABY3VPS8_9MYCO|nr:hypothetical protein [Mycobacterium paraterrae]UMB70131.1 hypothetical protein MKK62_01950 [Mycobacterium paraterrae]